MWIIVFLGVLAGLFIGIHRFSLEFGHDAVEIVYDLDALAQLASEQDLSLLHVLMSLNKMGYSLLGCRPAVWVICL